MSTPSKGANLSLKRNLFPLEGMESEGHSWLRIDDRAATYTSVAPCTVDVSSLRQAQRLGWALRQPPSFESDCLAHLTLDPLAFRGLKLGEIRRIEDRLVVTHRHTR